MGRDSVMVLALAEIRDDQGLNSLQRFEKSSLLLSGHGYCRDAIEDTVCTPRLKTSSKYYFYNMFVHLYPAAGTILLAAA